jgi:putative redox protein
MQQQAEAVMAKQGEPVIEGVEVSLTGRGKFQVEVRTASGDFLADEPEAVGGLASGPTPNDLLASALGACTAMTLRLYAERKGWRLRGATVRVLHRSGGLAARDRFAREIVLDGDLGPEQRRRLLEIANRCPVHQTLERGADVISVLAEAPLAGGLDPEPIEHASDMAAACEQVR